MYRLQVLPIRLVILSLALLCLWLTAPGWIQPMVRLSLQRTFGTAVDFEKCHLDWSQGGLQLTNVQISDPEDPLRNLIQANQVWVEFNPQSLWTRQWEVRSARWNEIVLGSPRPNLAGDRLNGATPGWKQKYQEQLAYDLDLAAKGWLDQVQSLPPVERGVSAAAFASITKSIRADWENEFQRQRKRTNALRDEISALKRELNQSGGNPLRLAAEEKARLARLTDLEGELEEVRDWLSNWPQIQEQALLQLAGSRKHGAPSQLPHSNFIAATQKSSQALLVSELDLQTARQLVDWSLLLSRRLAELRETAAQAPERGKPIAVRGIKPMPGIVVREMDFSGSFHSTSGHIDFTGNCRNLTDRPALADSPLEFHVKGQGQRAFQIEGNITSEDGLTTQTMQVQLLPCNVPSSEVGTASSVLITASPHRMQAEGLLQIRGEQLEGTIKCFHSQLGLYVNSLSEIAGGQNVLEKLNRQLATVQSIEVTAVISGTVSEPEVRFESNLAETFTPALAECLNESLLQQATYNQALIEQTYDTVVQSLIDYATAETKSLQTELSAEQVRFSELDRQRPANSLRQYR
ncbi:MAG: hypothetical protein LW697_07170 [Blastopirellula sp.]|nr:hypothetical protein [Blastopirellula sp.]